MKIVRFQYGGNTAYGSLDGENIRLLHGSPFDNNPSMLDSCTTGILHTNDVSLLAPSQPTKIVCLGLNYHTHARELNLQIPELPLIFLKPTSAVINPNDTIILPAGSERIDYECELGVVIGKKAKNIPEIETSKYILGYTCFNDVTDRIAQDRDGQWTRAKGYDTFAPFGPCIETEISPSDLKLETIVNGEVRQSGRTSDLIFGIPKIVSFISSIMTLMPGDIIATGTPEGIGPMKPGDTVEIRIEGIGILRNHVIGSD